MGSLELVGMVSSKMDTDLFSIKTMSGLALEVQLYFYWWELLQEGIRMLSMLEYHQIGRQIWAVHYRQLKEENLG